MHVHLHTPTQFPLPSTLPPEGDEELFHQLWSRVYQYKNRDLNLAKDYGCLLELASFYPPSIRLDTTPSAVEIIDTTRQALAIPAWPRQRGMLFFLIVTKAYTTKHIFHTAAGAHVTTISTPPLQFVILGESPLPMRETSRASTPIFELNWPFHDANAPTSS